MFCNDQSYRFSSLISFFDPHFNLHVHSARLVVLRSSDRYWSFTRMYMIRLGMIHASVRRSICVTCSTHLCDNIEKLLVLALSDCWDLFLSIYLDYTSGVSLAHTTPPCPALSREYTTPLSPPIHSNPRVINTIPFLHSQHHDGAKMRRK